MKTLGENNFRNNLLLLSSGTTILSIFAKPTSQYVYSSNLPRVWYS